MNISPIDNPVIESIREQLETCKESQEYGYTMDSIIQLCNRIQTDELKDRVLSLCFMDSESFTDEQCLQLVENLILSL